MQTAVSFAHFLSICGKKNVADLTSLINKLDSELLHRGWRHFLVEIATAYSNQRAIPAYIATAHSNQRAIPVEIAMIYSNQRTLTVEIGTVSCNHELMPLNIAMLL